MVGLDNVQVYISEYVDQLEEAKGHLQATLPKIRQEAAEASQEAQELNARGMAAQADLRAIQADCRAAKARHQAANRSIALITRRLDYLDDERRRVQTELGPYITTGDHNAG